jgi:Peptidase family M23
MLRLKDGRVSMKLDAWNGAASEAREMTMGHPLRHSVGSRRARSHGRGPGRSLVVLMIAAVCLLVWLLAAAPAGAATTALRVEATGAPKYVHGSDGRVHVEYDLVITNAFTAEATLTSLEVRGDGKRLLTRKGAALTTATRRLQGSTPTVSIAAASTAVTYVDVVLPRSAGRRVPRRLTNRIRYAIPADAPLRSVIGSTTVDAPDLRTDRRAPIVIASPLRGSGWLNGNGCCGDFTALHRNTVLPSNGSYVTFELFAVDWVRLAGGLLYTGDGRQNSDWPAYGAALYAVADGTVVSTVNNKPDIPPLANPDLNSPQDYGGNNVIIKIGAHRYATYAHLQPGSVRVKRGQRVRTGQQIGRLGNSGNTTAPHLHFGIQNGPSFFSDSLPFEIDHYTLEGTADPASTPPRTTVTGTPHRQRRTHPLIYSVITLTPDAR